MKKKKDQELKPILEGDALAAESKETEKNNTECVASQNEEEEPQGKWKKKCLNISLTLAAVIFGVMWQITLPMTSIGLIRVKSDLYPILLQPFWAVIGTLFLIIPLKCLTSCDISIKPENAMLTIGAGFSNVLTCVLQVYGSLPVRTPPQLQVILSTILVPFTVLAKYMLYKQGVGTSQGVCVILVMVGLIVSMIPQFLPSGEMAVALVEDQIINATSTLQPLPLYARVLWPIAFAIGYLPFGMMTVLVEKELINEQPHPIVMHLYVQLISFFAGLALFWTDLIPGFGMADDLPEFGQHLWNGLVCMFKTTDGCDNLFYRWWFGCFAYTATYICQFLQICYSSGAIYSVLVLSTTLPIGTLFWSLFDDTTHLLWHPQFTIQTSFVIVGLLILMPAIVAYDILSAKKYQEYKKNDFQKLKD